MWREFENEISQDTLFSCRNKLILRPFQIRGSQIVEAVRLHKVGFPKHMPLSEFRRRFGLLSSDANIRPGSPVADERRAVEDMLLSVDVDLASYRVGQSQVNLTIFYSTISKIRTEEPHLVLKPFEQFQLFQIAQELTLPSTQFKASSQFWFF